MIKYQQEVFDYVKTSLLQNNPKYAFETLQGIIYAINKGEVDENYKALMEDKEIQDHTGLTTKV